jgi:hypothetical protein
MVNKTSRKLFLCLFLGKNLSQGMKISKTVKPLIVTTFNLWVKFRPKEIKI